MLLLLVVIVVIVVIVVAVVVIVVVDIVSGSPDTGVSHARDVPQNLGGI